jgi:Cys-tRNA(Pro)/Cys-tRNA(Cys) deacylase
MPRRSSSSTPAARAAAAAGVLVATHAYEHDARAPSFALEAAERLGVEPRRVFKTLVCRLGDGEFVVAVVPAARQLSLKRLAAAAGAKEARMADPRDAERLTGYVTGGISPLGQRRRLRTLVDRSAAGQETVFVSGGRRGLELELRPEDLVQLTSGALADLAAD